MNDQNEISLTCGRITGLYGNVLQGWARDPSKPELRLVIEIYIDGHSVALTKANEFHPEADGGDDFNGFTVQLRESWLSSAKTVSARIANQEGWLVGTVQLPAPSPADPAPAASQVWHTGGLKVSGWAFDATDPNRAVTVTVREGTETLATVTANRLHHALAYKASRHHGFEIDLPWSLADGKVHKLEVRSESGQALSGSPLILCCRPEGVEALLRYDPERVTNSANLELLSKVAHYQELLLPKSAGFHHYKEWFDVFQKPYALDLKPQHKCGVLVISSGDILLDAISNLSARQSRYKAQAIEQVEESDILPGLKRLMMQGCDSFIPVKSGDRLAAYAIDHLVPLLVDGIAWAYGDCDCDSVTDERRSPWFKPVWDIDYFIGSDIFSSGAIFSIGTIMDAVRISVDEVESTVVDWHRFMASVALLTEQLELTVAHLPLVLYHRHHSQLTTPAEAAQCEARENAMNWLVQSMAAGASVDAVEGFPSLLKVYWPLPKALPKVSIIIPTRDQAKMLRTCVEGVLEETDYPNLEIIIVDNDSSELDTIEYFSQLRTRGVIVLPHPFEFNYAAVNNRAAEIATGDFICLLNNDVEILSADWLRILVSEALLPNVGVVGAKLLWENGMVQHGGVVIGINGLAAHIGNELHDFDEGYLANNQLTHQRSSVTGACMLMRKDLYLTNGGMDERVFPVAFNDVDLCLRIRLSGLKVKISAQAKLIHAESASRGKDVTKDRRSRANREQSNFIARWTNLTQTDPFYHPCLSLDYLSGAYTSLAMPPRGRAPRTNRVGDNQGLFRTHFSSSHLCSPSALVGKTNNTTANLDE